MFALVAAVLLAFAFGIATGQEVDNVPAERLPAMLQHPEYAAPVLAPRVEPFQEVECADECVQCCPLVVQDSYWYAGVDLLATQFNYHSTAALYLSDDDAAVGLRPYLGWESTTGVGLRGRWWFFEAEADTRPSTAINFQPTGSLEVTASNLDIDFYRRFYYDKTSFLLGAGTKVASVDLTHAFYSDYDIVGGGVSAFAEGYHPLYLGLKNEWAFIGYGRFGLLTGRLQHGGRPDGWEYTDTNMSITELGLGIEWKHKFQRCDFVFQIVSEMQRWETNLTSDLAFDALGLRFGGGW
jgi:hypothetical protein